MKSKLLIIIQSIMIITLVWVIFLIGSDKILLDSDIDEEDDEGNNHRLY
jgi:hypothetical protein